ncbi:MAG: hypothetical protein NC095_11280 [Muribaculum sp.]|nr:hypothetical protein [Muribaculum sp.]
MQLTITIDIKELIYDIQNKTYLTGRSRSDGKNYRQVALMQANNDDENYNQIMRSIGNAFARVKTELSEVMSTKTANSNNQLELNNDTKVLSLVMPSNFNSAATDAITAAIHQFIVTSATSEWFMITNKTDTEDYSRLAQESLELLRESLCKRSRPSRSTSPTEEIP